MKEKLEIFTVVTIYIGLGSIIGALIATLKTLEHALAAGGILCMLGAISCCCYLLKYSPKKQTTKEEDK